MAQRQGDGRLGVIVFGGRQHFGEAHDLAVFVGDLDTDRGLARNHLDHTHAGHGKRTRKVLGEVGNAADLDAGGWLDLVTSNHRTGMDGVYRHLHTEFLELDFQQVADSRQRLRRIVELFLLRRVEDGNRRQSTLNCAVHEQRGLLFLHHTLAGLYRLRRRWRDDCGHVLFALGHVFAQRRFTLHQTLSGLGLLAPIGRYRRDHIVDAHVHFTQLRNHLLALGAGSPPAVCSALKQFEQVEGDLAGDIHHLEPGQVGKHGQTE